MQQKPQRIGSYQVLRELGRGGMGVVYEVQDPNMRRTLALKLILQSQASKDAVERFWRESDALSKVQHSNVVRVIKAGRAREGPFLLMERVEGEPLKKLIAQGPVEAREAARIMIALAGAIEAVHEHGILHRDIEPGNVIMTPAGQPVLLDFGLARDQNAETLTKTGSALGTVSYMSPEQAAGEKTSTLGPTLDVYALGVVLYEMVVGQVPFEGSMADVLRQIITSEPEWPAARDRSIPRAMDAICRVAMANKAEDRYPTAQALREDLERFVRGERPEALRAISRGGPRLLAALALFVVVAIGVGVGAVISAGPRRLSPEEAAEEAQALSKEAWQLLSEEGDLSAAGASVAPLLSRLALVEASQGEGPAIKGLGRAQQRVQSLAGLLALARGDRPSAKAAAEKVAGAKIPAADLLRGALAATGAGTDAAAADRAARDLARGLSRGAARRELRLWRIAALVRKGPSQREAEEALTELEPLLGADPQGPERSLRIQLLVAAERFDDARADLSGFAAAPVHLRWTLALAEGAGLLEGDPQRALDLVSPLATEAGLPAQVQSRRTAFGRQALERAASLVREPGPRAETSLIPVLHLAKRLLPKEPLPTSLKEALRARLNDVQAGLPNVDLALTVAELADDDGAVQRDVYLLGMGAANDAKTRRRLVAVGERAVALTTDRQQRLDLQIELCTQFVGLGDYQRCIDLSERILPTLSEPASRARVLAVRARSFSNLKAYLDALDAVDEAIELQPDTARLLFMRARIKDGLGESESAVADAMAFLRNSAQEISGEKEKAVALVWDLSPDRGAAPAVFEAVELLCAARQKGFSGWWIRSAWLHAARDDEAAARERLTTCAPWIGEEAHPVLRGMAEEVVALQAAPAAAALLALIEELDKARGRERAP